MVETSAEKYRDHLISFVVPNPNRRLPSDDRWIGWIGEVISVDGPVFRLAPCNYDQPHERLNQPTEWFDVRHVRDIKVVPNVG